MLPKYVWHCMHGAYGGQGAAASILQPCGYSTLLSHKVMGPHVTSLQVVSACKGAWFRSIKVLYQSRTRSNYNVLLPSL